MNPRTSEVTVDVQLSDEEWMRRLVADTVTGLTSTPKEISPVWFYDARGSELFDQITRLPEYYLTRAERSLLATAAAGIADASRADTLVELGSGTSEKTRLLLDAMAATGQLRRYVPFDVSEPTLRAAAAELAVTYPGMEIHAVVGDFHDHLGAVPTGGRRLVAFLGSTIGNLRPPERQRLLTDLVRTMGPEDRLLLGVDLVKDPATLIAAYDDAAGVTAAFNRNALRVMNARLGSDFQPDTFDHVALWEPEDHWIEMRLRSRVEQAVSLPSLGLTARFAAGEDLRTEISAKFTAAGIRGELEAAGFQVEEAWDESGAFLLVLARPA